MHIQDRPASANKLYGIEIVRFFCAIAVLLTHYENFSSLPGTTKAFVPSHQPYYGLLGPVYEQGMLGVQFFWCISGFIFFWKYKDAIRTRKVSGYNFFVLRFSRLYPLHFATLLLIALVQIYFYANNGHYFVLQTNNLRYFILHLFMASHWGLEQHGFSFNGPIWSVSVELLVYFFFYFSTGWLGASLAVVTAMVGVFALAVKLNLYSDDVFLCALLFYLGGFAAVVSEKLSVRGGPPAVIAAAVATLAVVGVAVIDFFQPHHFKLHHLLSIVISAPSLVYLAAQHFDLPARLAKAIAIAGNMTYSSYLLHFPIQAVLAIYCTNHRMTFDMYDRRFFLSFMTVTLMLSFLTYRYFEMPAQRLLRRKLLRSAKRPVRDASSIVIS